MYFLNMTYKNCVIEAFQALGYHDIWSSVIHFIALVNSLYISLFIYIIFIKEVMNRFLTQESFFSFVGLLNHDLYTNNNKNVIVVGTGELKGNGKV